MARTEEEIAEALDAFVLDAYTTMRKRLDDGAQKFGALSWRDEPYTDGQNSERLRRAVTHLHNALYMYRMGSVGPDEVQKRAADVANQAFMLADPKRRDK